MRPRTGDASGARTAPRLIAPKVMNLQGEKICVGRGRRSAERTGVVKSRSMERVGQVFGSFEDAEVADDRFYAGLTAEERLDILLELVERHRSGLGETASRFERVHRIVELSRR
jgi:hypothetical protein